MYTGVSAGRRGNMAFTLYYNRLFPLRMINPVKKYLDAGGNILVDHRAAAQLSKLQVLDYFFPGLFVRDRKSVV